MAITHPVNLVVPSVRVRWCAMTPFPAADFESERFGGSAATAGTVDALLALALERVTRDPRETLALAKSAEALSSALDYPAGRVAARLTQGRVALAREDTAEASRLAEDALAEATALGRTDLQGQAQGLLATLLAARGAWGEAVAVGLLSLDLLSDSGTPDEKGSITELVGTCFDELEDAGSAADYLERSLEYFEESGSERAVARLHNRIASALCDAGEPESAAARAGDADGYIRDFVARHGELPYAAADAELALNRARLFCLGQRWQVALSAVERGLESAPDGSRVGQELSRVRADILMALGRNEEAEQLLQRLEEDETLVPVARAMVHDRLATLRARRGDYESALTHAEHFHLLDKAFVQEQRAQQEAMTRALFETQAARREAELLAQKNTELEGLIGELRQLHAQVQELSRRDGLTGLYNRRHLDEQLPAVFARARERDEPLALLMADLDDFKAINDQYRHQTGDRVLQELATILIELAPGDGSFAVRYGGEEFALVMPGCGAQEGGDIAEEFCRRVRGAPWADLGLGTALTVSVGVAESTDTATGDELLQHADEAMYEAKRAGKDQAQRFTPRKEGAA